MTRLLSTLLLLLALVPPAAARDGDEVRPLLATAAWLFLVLVSLAVLFATTLFLYAYCGRRIREVARVRERRPLVSFLVGLPLGIVLLLLVAITWPPPTTRLFSLLLFAVSLIALAVGFAGSALELGRRLLLPEDPVATDLRCLVVGFPLIVLFGCLPFFGWAFLVFYVLGGLGALVLSWREERPLPPTVEPQAPLASNGSHESG
jgi:hypothetical protein